MFYLNRSSWALWWSHENPIQSVADRLKARLFVQLSFKCPCLNVKPCEGLINVVFAECFKVRRLPFLPKIFTEIVFGYKSIASCLLWRKCFLFSSISCFESKTTATKQNIFMLKSKISTGCFIAVVFKGDNVWNVTRNVGFDRITTQCCNISSLVCYNLEIG